MAYITLLTTAGLAKIASAVANKTKVSLTEMAVGDGGGSAVTPSASQTALVNETYRGNVNEVKLDALGHVNAELVIPNTFGGFTVREVGIYDADGDLFAVGSLPEVYKPLMSENAAAELLVNMAVSISNTQAITLTANASTLATQMWVEANFVRQSVLAGGTTGEVLAKASNADMDVEWLSLGDGIQIDITSRIEEQTLADGQTAITLTTITTDGVAVFIEGAREFDFTVVNDTQLTLDQSYPAGTRIWFVQNEPVSQKQDFKAVAGGGVTVSGNRYFVTDDTAPVTLPNVGNLQTGNAVTFAKAHGTAPTYQVHGGNGETITNGIGTDTSADHVAAVEVTFIYNAVTNKWEY